MKHEDAFKAMADGTLKKGCLVTIPQLREFEGKLVEIDGVFTQYPRLGDFDDPWPVIIVKGQIIDTAWIGDIVKEGQAPC